MTRLHEQYISGNILTAGDSGQSGTSGLNVMAARVNFGGFDFPQIANMAFTSGVANEILTAAYTGENQSYVQTISYNAEISPTSVIVSGTSMGSVVEWVFYYATGGSLATSTGGLIAGSISIT